MFIGRNLLIATKHSKEKVIANIVESQLGVKCFTEPLFDTDLFGTFSGEVERVGDPLSVARLKCIKAIEFTNTDLVIASEGSFGPHPDNHFISVDDELIMLIDIKNNLEIVAREVSMDTNICGSLITKKDELVEIIRKSQFPSHGLILRSSKEDFVQMVKGVVDEKKLFETVDSFLSKFGCCYVETDMRASFNPTRMKVIEAAAHKLAQKANTKCPQCDTPGFSISGVEKGLLCSFCKLPTRGILKNIFKCKNCNFISEVMFPNLIQVENPQFCDYCNP